MILKLLEELHKKNIEYVSWKNNHEINLALDGKSDLDIFIPLSQKKTFLNIASEYGWMPLLNPVANYPNIYHFYNFDEQLTSYHLHVYFEVITGESWLKEYNLPLTDFLIQNRKKLNNQHLYILNENAQAYLFALRHYLKGGSIFSRILYKRELNSYRKEWSQVRDSYDPSANSELFDLSLYREKSGLKKDSFDIPSIRIAKTVRKKLSTYLRFPIATLPFKRCKSLIHRALNKVFFKQKKTFIKEGRIIVLTGADGVGKSTMIREIYESYEPFLTVKTASLGKPQGSSVEWIRRNVVSTKEKKIDKEKKDSSVKKLSLKKLLSAVVLAFLRLKAAKKALEEAKKGNLVISDRWPTIESGKMDGPKIQIHEGSTLLVKLFAKIETKLYRAIPFADYSFILTIPVESAVERNRKREKSEKETDEEIIERHKVNKEFTPKSNKIFYFDNDGPLKEKRVELIHLIQKKLSDDQRKIVMSDSPSL
ncbi:MAG: hypothetical protein WD607_07035 [Candidatus Paceibacterota bacterium]